MIIVELDDRCPKGEMARMIQHLEGRGSYTRLVPHERAYFILSDAPVAAAAELEGHPRLRRILETKSPFPLASRALWEGTNPVRVGEGLALGDGGAVVMAGPCSVEGREQILESARAVRSAGAAGS